MNILMTGGTGLIGHNFATSYPSYQYTIVSRTPDHAQIYAPKNARIIANLSSLQNLDNFDAVINLAGEPIIDKRWTDKQKRIICDSRWQTTQQLVDLIHASTTPPSVFISGSAIGIYGNKEDSSITEEEPIEPVDFPSQLCSQWETIAQQAENTSRVVYLRTGIVLDTSAGALGKMLLPFKLCLGGPIGGGKQFMSWIHIRDMVRAMDFLLNNASCEGPFNITAPNPVQNRTFSSQLARTLGRFAILPAPKFALKLILGESSMLLLDSQKVLPEKLLQQGFEFEYDELKPALEHLLS